MDFVYPYYAGYLCPAILCIYVELQFFQGLIFFFHDALVHLLAIHDGLTLKGVQRVLQEYDWLSYVCKYKYRVSDSHKLAMMYMQNNGELYEFIKLMSGGMTRGVLICKTTHISQGGYYIHLR